MADSHALIINGREGSNNNESVDFAVRETRSNVGLLFGSMDAVSGVCLVLACLAWALTYLNSLGVFGDLRDAAFDEKQAANQEESPSSNPPTTTTVATSSTTPAPTSTPQMFWHADSQDPTADAIVGDSTGVFTTPGNSFLSFNNLTPVGPSPSFSEVVFNEDGYSVFNEFNNLSSTSLTFGQAYELFDECRGLDEASAKQYLLERGFTSVERLRDSDFMTTACLRETYLNDCTTFRICTNRILAAHFSTSTKPGGLFKVPYLTQKQPKELWLVESKLPQYAFI